MVLAFSNFKQIDCLPSNQEKHRAWLKQYENKNYGFGMEGHMQKGWEWTKHKYKDSLWEPGINYIGRLANETRIEFDGNEQKAKEDLEKTALSLKEKGFGFIRSSHKGKSDYLWVQFNRPVSDREAEAFLKWIAPEGSQVDLNFSSSNKIFPVLFAVHGKHSYQIELPIEFYEGNQINFDDLNIKSVSGIKTSVNNAGFEYENFVKTNFDYKNELQLWQFEDFKQLKEDKSFIIQNVLYPKTISMIYSPPGEFKSLISLYAGFCIATGQDWLRFKTKRMPVLYCDKENNDNIIKKRFEALHHASGYKRKKFPLYILRRNGDLLDKNFNDRLKEAVKKYKIKVVFFDTLHRFADYDENKSDDLNRIYMQIFQPLVEEFGCSVVYLHHSKKDGGYRGTGDFLGMVDTAYQIVREKSANSKKSNAFRIINEKSRAGEIEQVRGEIDFAEDSSYIKINRLDEVKEDEKEVHKLKAITEKIKEFVPEGEQLHRKDIETAFEMAKIDYSISTLKRSLNWLVKNKYFDYNEKKRTYSKVLR